MFGRKKKEEESINEIETQPTTIEVNEEDIVTDASPQEIDSPLPSTTPIPTPPPTIVQKPEAQARIEASELVNINGNQYYRFVLLANKSIGEVGETLPLD
jgi:hypothetical protein|tara:strand:- start:109 stop:408 length:300 start_codon:yes stop_codon:yes gene_type:complete